MQRNPKCIIYGNNFIIVNIYKIYNNNNILNGFQQQLIHGFNYAPPYRIHPMFFRSVFHLKHNAEVFQNFKICHMTHPKLIDGLNCESKGEDSKRKKNWGMLLGS